MRLPSSYVNAVAVSSQKTLIPRSKFNSMIESADADEAVKVLVGGGFGGGVEISGAEDYEKLVDFERNKLKEFLSEYSLCKDLLLYAYMRADCFNCDVAVRKIILKAEGIGYSPDGEIPVSAIEGYVGGDKKAEIPDYLKRTIDKLKAACENEKVSGVELTSVLMRAQYGEMLKKLKNPALKKLVRAEIDAKNIAVYFRSDSVEEALKQYIDGGNIKRDKLRLLNFGDDMKIRNAFLFTPCYDYIDKCLNARAEKRPFSEYEKAIDEIPLRQIYDKRYKATGITPMLTYYLYKTAEIKNVRTVMSGKLANVPAGKILERLRFGYVG